MYLGSEQIYFKYSLVLANLLIIQEKQTLFLQIFGLLAFIEQKENDRNDNLCKIHGGLYIASALNTKCRSNVKATMDFT